MQWYSLMRILPFHRVLVTMASHFQNFPPKTLHAIVARNANPCLSKSSCHDCKSFSKLIPPKALHAMVFLNAHPSLSYSSCHDCKSFSKLPSPKPYMQWYSSMQIPPFDRVLVTIASYFLNFLSPKPLHAIVVLNANPSLSKSSCHDCKSFSKLPPQSPPCNRNPQCKSLPFIQFLSRLHVIF